MISKKTYKEVIDNLEKVGVKKFDYKNSKLNDIYLNISSRSDIEINELNNNFKITAFWERTKEECFDQFPTYKNVRNKYDLFEQTDNYFQKYDFYLLPNEFFGYDSSKIKALEIKAGKTRLFKSPDKTLDEGIFQTLILIDKNPIDGKAQFFFYRSLYCDFVYGTFVFETQKFHDDLEKTIKKIFGTPIINYWVNKNLYSNFYSDWKKHCLISGYTAFKQYLKNDYAKQIDIQTLYEQSSIFAQKENYFFKEVKNIQKSDLYFQLRNDFIGDLSTFKIEPFGKMSFWTNKDIKYLYFYELDKEFFEIKNINLDQDPYRNLAKNASSKYLEWQNYFDFSTNILFSNFVQNPILIWDQRNYRNLFYKLIIPGFYFDHKNTQKGKIVLKKIKEKMDKMNKNFQNYIIKAEKDLVDTLNSKTK